MKRRVFYMLTAMSLVLCAASGAFWLRTCQGVRFDLDRRGDPTIGFLALDGELTLFAQSARSLEINPDAKGDTAIFFAGFGYARDSDHRNMRSWELALPLWTFPAISAVLPLLAIGRQVRRKRSLVRGRCVICGYDLCATPDRCPECGHIAAHRPVQSAA